MFNQLKNGFILVSITALMIVMCTYILGSNLVNYHQMMDTEKRTLNTLCCYYQSSQVEKIDEEVSYESRYFAVLFNTQGEIVSMDRERIYSLPETELRDLAMKAYHSRKNTDYQQDFTYKFKKVKTKKGQVIVFYRCKKHHRYFKLFLFRSVLMGFMVLFFFIIIIIISSKKVIKPFVETYERQKSFISDAGHDIKTPITIIEADAEILGYKFDNNEWVEDIKKQTERLRMLTEDLIYLSKLDERPSSNRIDFPLSDVAEEISQSFIAVAKAQNKQLVMKIQPNISFYGDLKGFERVIFILLDNALKYSSDNSTIYIELKKEKQIELTVVNQVDSINENEIECYFDRFYRGDSSRNSQTGGHGIGLSIAKSVIESHLGQIKVSAADEHTIIIKVII